MAVDPERHRRICESLAQSPADALVCWSPTEVLLLTGYWPVMGSAVAVFAKNGDVQVIIPEDELHLAQASSAARFTTYRPGGLDSLSTPVSAITHPLASILESMGLSGKTVAVETEQGMQPASYASAVTFRSALHRLIKELGLSIKMLPCEAIVEPLKAVKTAKELAIMSQAAKVAADGFSAVPACLVPGTSEAEIAAEAHYAFETSPHAASLQRSYSFFYCMSGPNSARASAAFAQTGHRRIEAGDLVLVHANTCADGYWTDVTRTYVVGEPSARQTEIRSAIDKARAAAFASIRPGAAAREVDHAARAVMVEHGLGKAFRHSTGHGVGFQAANPNGLPRIHPKSPDVLEAGMTFNVEPAAYFDGYGGMRHCDVVAVIETGVVTLTDF